MYGTTSRKNFFHSNSIMNLTRNHLQNLIEHEVQQISESAKVRAFNRLAKSNPEIVDALKKIGKYLMDENTGLMQHRFDPHYWQEKVSNWLSGADYLNDIPVDDLGVSRDGMGLRLKKHVEDKRGGELDGPLGWEDIAEFLQGAYDKYSKQLFPEPKTLNEGLLLDALRNGFSQNVDLLSEVRLKPEQIKKLAGIIKKFKDAGGKLSDKWQKWYQGWVENTNPPLFKRMPRVPKPKALRAKTTWDFRDVESDNAIDAVGDMIQGGHYATGKDKDQAIEDLIDLIIRRQELNRHMKGALYDLDSFEGKLQSEFPIFQRALARTGESAYSRGGLRAHLRKELGLGPERPKRIRLDVDHEGRAPTNRKEVARREEKITAWDKEYEYDATGNVIKKIGPRKVPRHDAPEKIAPSLRSSHPWVQGSKYYYQLQGHLYKRPKKMKRGEWGLHTPASARADILGVTQEKLAAIEETFPGGPAASERSYLNYEFKFLEQIEKWDKIWQERAEAVRAWDKKYPGWHPAESLQSANLDKPAPWLPDIPQRPGGGGGLWGQEFPGKSWSKLPWFSDKKSYESFIHNKKGGAGSRRRAHTLTPEEELALANADDKVNAAERLRLAYDEAVAEIGDHDRPLVAKLRAATAELDAAERARARLKAEIPEHDIYEMPGSRPSEEWPDPNSPHKEYVRKYGTYKEFVQTLPRTWEEYLQNLKKKQDEWDRIFEPILTKQTGEQLDLFKEQNEMNTLTKQQLKRLIVEMLPDETTETLVDIYDEENEDVTLEKLEFWELLGPVIDGTVEEIGEYSTREVPHEQFPALIDWMRNTRIDKLIAVADKLELGEKPMNENTFRKLVREEAIKLMKEQSNYPVRELDIKQMIADTIKEELDTMTPDESLPEGEPEEVGVTEPANSPSDMQHVDQMRQEKELVARRKAGMAARRDKLHALARRMRGL